MGPVAGQVFGKVAKDARKFEVVRQLPIPARDANFDSVGPVDYYGPPTHDMRELNTVAPEAHGVAEFVDIGATHIALGADRPARGEVRPQGRRKHPEPA